MQNFYYDIPTKVFFGEGQIQNLPELVSEFGQRALLVYGGGSVKRSGLYDTVAAKKGRNYNVGPCGRGAKSTA